MSTASFKLARGASAVGADAAHHRHILGDALRAVRVYAEAAFRVAILGEYAEESPVTHR
jgi:hypothetical protein